MAFSRGLLPVFLSKKIISVWLTGVFSLSRLAFSKPSHHRLHSLFCSLIGHCADAVVDWMNNKPISNILALKYFFILFSPFNMNDKDSYK